jgi:hypothetical protein
MFLLEEALYTEGPLFLLFTSLLFLCRRRCFFFLALAFSSQRPLPLTNMVSLPLMPTKA